MRRLLLYLLSAIAFAAPNSITISDTTGSAQPNRPFSISRVFAKDDICEYPAPQVGTTPIASWQSDVKNRWPASTGCPSGSVKHAIISFVTAVPANGSVTVGFTNSSNPCSAGSQAACDAAALTDTAAMLNPAWMSGAPPWDAQMEFTSGSTVKVNARSMLGALAINPAKVRYWLRGPVVTQVLVEDRSTAMSQDIAIPGSAACGSESPCKSIHPWFVLTFYNGWNGVKVEFIAENAWTTKLQDLTYSLSLKVGPALTAAYTKGTFTHFSRARWHKTFWSGSQPGNVKIDYNFPYIIQSTVVPNYDTTRVVSSSGISQAVSAFNASDKGDIMGNGQYTPYFATTGGRPELGFVEQWAVQYLYTFHPSLYTVMLGNGDVAGHIPAHFRESQTSGGGQSCASSRCFDAARTADAFGRVLSIDARPTIQTLNDNGANAADAITPLGAVPCRAEWTLGCTTSFDSNAPNPFTIDDAHQAPFAFVPYLITGEYYYLEEMYFLAAYDLASSSSTCWVYGRCGTWGIIHEASIQTRGAVWALRNVMRAAFLAPDGSPEKAYFNEKLNYNLAVKEGQFNITDGAFYNTASGSPWSVGRQTFGGNFSNPLHYITYTNPGDGCRNDSSAIDPNVVCMRHFPWMAGMWQILVGNMQEMGFPTAKQSEYVAKHLIHILRDPGFNPYLIGAMMYPMYPKANNGYFQTWPAALGGYTSSFLSGQANGRFPSDVASPNDADFGYVAIGYAASAYLPGYADGTLTGTDARNWLVNALSSTNASGLLAAMNDNPKWAIVPRAAPAVGNCDANKDGSTDLFDVQAIVNQALGNAACTNDLTQDGRCDLFDVQRVIGAVLSGTCPVGP